MVFDFKKFLLELIGISIVVLFLILVLVDLLIEDNKAFEIIYGYILSLIIFVLNTSSIRTTCKNKQAPSQFYYRPGAIANSTKSFWT